MIKVHHQPKSPRDTDILKPVSLVASWERDLLRMAAPQVDATLKPHIVQSIAAHVQKLWAKFNTDRQSLDREYMSDEKMLMAYLAAFFLPNVARTQSALSNKNIKSQLLWLKQQTSLRILDFGSGPLSCSIGLLLALNDLAANDSEAFKDLKEIEIVATERSEKAVRIGQKWMTENLNPRISLTVERLTSIPQHSFFDIVLAANVLNEIPEKHQLKTIESLLACASSVSPSLFLILEPGQDVHSKKLSTIRDELLSRHQSAIEIIAPCPHQGPCPLSAASGRLDWCWFKCKFDAPDLLIEIDKKTLLNHGELAYSFLAVSQKQVQTQAKTIPWAICVSDEMSVGSDEGAAKRATYFHANLANESAKPKFAEIEKLARDGRKTKLCTSKGELLAGIRASDDHKPTLLRGDSLSGPEYFEIIIFER